MPIKLTKTSLNLDGGPTPKAVVQEMVTHYKGNLKYHGDREIARKYPKRKNKNQGSCIWVSVTELMQLITDNGANGIRVYFGQHTPHSEPTGESEYLDLITTIFVATRDNVHPSAPKYDNSEDLLYESDDERANTIVVAGPFGGQALDKVPICNPTCPTKASGMMKIDIGLTQ